VTWAIILLNVLVWLYEVRLPEQSLNQFIGLFGATPARFFSGDVSAFITIFTSMFIHSSWMHIIGNMLYLFIFGDNVEDRLGHVLYLIFYLAGGFAALVLQTLVNPGSNVPMVGASGAIAAVLGAYLVLFPGQRVKTLVIFVGIVRVAYLPAIIMLGLWFVTQLFSGFAAITQTSASAGGVAFFAHIGGFIFGALAGLIARAVDGGNQAVVTERHWN